MALQPRSGNESSKAPASELDALKERCENYRRAAHALQVENTALRVKAAHNDELISLVATLRAENEALRAANERLRETREPPKGLEEEEEMHGAKDDEENYSPLERVHAQSVPPLTAESTARISVTPASCTLCCSSCRCCIALISSRLSNATPTCTTSP